MKKFFISLVSAIMIFGMVFSPVIAQTTTHMNFVKMYCPALLNV